MGTSLYSGEVAAGRRAANERRHPVVTGFPVSGLTGGLFAGDPVEHLGHRIAFWAPPTARPGHSEETRRAKSRSDPAGADTDVGQIIEAASKQGRQAGARMLDRKSHPGRTRKPRPEPLAPGERSGTRFARTSGSSPKTIDTTFEGSRTIGLQGTRFTPRAT